MRNRLILTLVLCTALAGAYVYGQGFGQTPTKFTVSKVADDLFVLFNEFVPGNTVALVTSEGVILVDDKFEIDHENILAAVKTFTNQPIRYVINTHHHGDHTGGNARMQAMNVHVIASERARANMADANMPGAPTVTFERQAYVTLGGKRVELHHFGRAHTDGDTVVLFPAHRVVAMGDMYTYGERTPQLIDYAGGGSAREWTRTLDAVLQLPFDRVVPGYGIDVTTRAELQKFRDSTVTLNTRVRQMIREKRSRDEIAKMLASEFHWADLQIARGLDGMLVELQ